MERFRSNLVARTVLPLFSLSILWVAAPAFATVTITSPANGAKLTSPVNFVATASASTCAKGVAAMGIYVDNVLAYSVKASSLNNSLSLNPGAYSVVLEEWDNCGGATTSPLTITVVSSTAASAVTVTSPSNGASVSSPVTYSASATTSCASGIAAMGIYVNNSLAYKVNAASIHTALTLSPGTYSTAVQEWDNCGASSNTHVAITIPGTTAPNGVVVTAPANGESTTSPVTFTATAASTTCAKGVAAMGIYVNNALEYKVDASSLNTQVALSTGTKDAVVKLWDNCDGVLSTPVQFTVTASNPGSAAQVIKHVVVIIPENVSFDHYFGTYPTAENLSSDPVKFTAAAGTPHNISNYISTPSLLTSNPNLSTANGAGATNPFRLDANQAATADQDHRYLAEQTAFDAGRMDLFPLSVGATDGLTLSGETGAPSIADTTGLTMAYFDGNTVTGLWNYAQHYALNDHFFESTFGASTQGALNLISGQTNGVAAYTTGADSGVVADGQGGHTLISDEDPSGDLCSAASATVNMDGVNIGDLLNSAGISWGMFSGGFNLGATNANGSTGCKRSSASASIPGHPVVNDYVPHHEPFQYYASTANPTHIRPASVAVIGTAADTGENKANHQYDVNDFTAALDAGNLPAVSFVKAPAFQDGHAGYSDPLDEQTFLVNTINALEESPSWSSTAIIIAYDDSDGWYDHLTHLVNGSATSSDSLDGAGICISTAAAAAALPGPNSNGKPVQGRCGHGPRLPLIVISPWANKNYIDNTPTDQASVIRFIEDTFLNSKRIGTGSFDATAGTLDNMFNFSTEAAPNPSIVLLNPATGAVTTGN